MLPSLSLSAPPSHIFVNDPGLLVHSLHQPLSSSYLSCSSSTGVATGVRISRCRRFSKVFANLGRAKAASRKRCPRSKDHSSGHKPRTSPKHLTAAPVHREQEPATLHPSRDFDGTSGDGSFQRTSRHEGRVPLVQHCQSATVTAHAVPTQEDEVAPVLGGLSNRREGAGGILVDQQCYEASIQTLSSSELKAAACIGPLFTLERTLPLPSTRVLSLDSVPSSAPSSAPASAPARRNKGSRVVQEVHSQPPFDVWRGALSCRKEIGWESAKLLPPSLDSHGGCNSELGKGEGKLELELPRHGLPDAELLHAFRSSLGGPESGDCMPSPAIAEGEAKLEVDEGSKGTEHWCDVASSLENIQPARRTAFSGLVGSRAESHSDLEEWQETFQRVLGSPKMLVSNISERMRMPWWRGSGSPASLVQGNIAPLLLQGASPRTRIEEGTEQVVLPFRLHLSCPQSTVLLNFLAFGYAATAVLVKVMAGEGGEAALLAADAGVPSGLHSWAAGCLSVTTAIEFAVRFTSAALASSLLLWMTRSRESGGNKAPERVPTKGDRTGKETTLWFAGFDLGLWMFVTYAGQAIGLQTAAAHDAAIILTASVVLVPFLEALEGSKLHWSVWGATMLACAGLLLLEGGEAEALAQGAAAAGAAAAVVGEASQASGFAGASVPLGHIWCFLGAVGSAVHVVRSEKYCEEHSPLQLVTLQLGTTAALGLAWLAASVWSGSLAPAQAQDLLLSEVTTPGSAVSSLGNAWASIPLGLVLLSGPVGTGLCEWLELEALQFVKASTATLILTASPLWASLLAFLTLGETMTLPAMMGAGLILMASLQVQLLCPCKED